LIATQQTNSNNFFHTWSMQVLIYIDINSKFYDHKNDDLGEIISRSGGFNQSTHECSYVQQDMLFLEVISNEKLRNLCV